MYNVQKGRSEDTYGYQLLSTEGMGRKIKEARYQTEDSAACFDVFVYQPNTEGDLELKVVDPHVSVPPMAPGEEFIPPAVQSYSFSVDKDLNITETDIYGCLPDCHKE